MAGEYINDAALDALLAYVSTNGTALHLCSAAPTTYAEASSTYQLGTATPSYTGPANAGSGTGRQVEIDAVTDGSVTGTGTATHIALSNGTNTLVYVRELSASQAVTSGNTWTMTATPIYARDLVPV